MIFEKRSPEKAFGVAVDLVSSARAQLAILIASLLAAAVRTAILLTSRPTEAPGTK